MSFGSNPYSYGYGYNNMGPDPLQSLENLGTGIAICSIIAIIGALLIFFIFLRKSNEYKFSGLPKWIYDFLSFKSMLVEALLKIGYMFLTIFTILMSIYMMFSASFFGGLLFMIFGVVIERIIFEFLLINVIICRNTSDINNKTAGNAPAFERPVQPAAAKRPDPVPAARPVQPRYTPPKYEQPAPDYRYNPEINPNPVRICSGCGSKLKPTAKFCQVCGKSASDR